MTGRGSEPRVAAAEAEADGEDRLAAGASQVRDARCDVRLDAAGVVCCDVRHVLELVVALRDSRRAAEVVEGDRRVSALGEPQRELLVEAVEAADVREDHDADARRLSSGVAANAAKRLPSAASRTRSSCETAAPEIGGIGGEESRSKHMRATLQRGDEPLEVARRSSTSRPTHGRARAPEGRAR